jgi:DNA-binding CsgD family transcriptional regulator
MLDFKLDMPCSDHRAVTANDHPAAPAARQLTSLPLLQAVLDSLPQGVVILDAAGRLAYWNAAARLRLTAAGWHLVDQQLRAADAADRDTLFRALPSVCARGRMQLLPLSLKGRPAHAALAPVNVQGQCWAALMLDRESLCGSIEMQLFASNNGLTAAESRVLSCLAHGLRPMQIAREHGVSLSTVQSQVAALRGKTRTSSVMDLLTHVARLPALQALHLGPRP